MRLYQNGLEHWEINVLNPLFNRSTREGVGSDYVNIRYDSAEGGPGGYFMCLKEEIYAAPDVPVSVPPEMCPRAYPAPDLGEYVEFVVAPTGETPIVAPGYLE